VRPGTRSTAAVSSSPSVAFPGRRRCLPLGWFAAYRTALTDTLRGCPDPDTAAGLVPPALASCGPVPKGKGLPTAGLSPCPMGESRAAAPLTRAMETDPSLASGTCSASGSAVQAAALSPAGAVPGVLADVHTYVYR